MGQKKTVHDMRGKPVQNVLFHGAAHVYKIKEILTYHLFLCMVYKD